MAYVLLLCIITALLAAVLGAGQVPADTLLEVRLQQQVSSLTSRPGNPVRGILIAPVRSGTKTLIPTGSRVSGVVREVRRVGWGLIHETARLLIDFTQLELPDGTTKALKTRLVEVDNARESVDRQGRLQGIRPTGTWAQKTSTRLAGFAMIDPIAFVFTQVAASRMLRFPEPEILLPAGTDLLVRLLDSIEVPPAANGALPAVARDQSDREHLAALVGALPHRTLTAKSGSPSDLTNVLFIGTSGALERAFDAAGWVEADTYRASTAFRTLRSFTENQGYRSAPMSTLLFDGQAPEYSLAKTLNTISKRHHVRIWSRPESWKGMQVLMASATQDVGIAFSPRRRTLVHVINERIDTERAKLVNDMTLTGCVEAAELIPRPWVPTNSRNATGDRMTTDGAIAVVRLNSCLAPHRSDTAVVAEAAPPRVSTPQRVSREALLTLRNDLVRGNLGWQAVSGARLAVRYLSGKTRARPVDRTTDVDGEAYPAAVDDRSRPGGSELPEEPDSAPARAVPAAGLRRPKVAAAADSRRHRWEPPMFEISLQGGSLRYPTHALDSVGFNVEPKTPAVRRVNFGLANLLSPGWAAGTSITLNSYRRFSGEFGFAYQRGRYRFGTFLLGGDPLGPGFSEQSTGLLTRQFHYNLLFHLKPSQSRLRPYLAAGPVLQLIHLTGAPVKRGGGPFRYGMNNIGMVRAAYNFGNSSPLDGGGIFQFAGQYGVGLKYRLLPHWLVRVDFRETIGPQPDFFPKYSSVDQDESAAASVTVTHPRLTGAFRQQRFTTGFAFVF